MEQPTQKDTSVSRHNATKHGLLSKEVLIGNENQQELSELDRSLHDALKPVGSLESILVDRIVSNLWRLRRALHVEKNWMDWQLSDEDFIVIGPVSVEQEARKKSRNTLVNESTDTILRYETTIERSLFRALHELERLQAKRSGKDTPLPSVLDIDLHGPEGFVSQNKS